MQLFLTDINVNVSARNLDDKRLIKQILECYQLLTLKPNNNYRNHPIAKWVNLNKNNYNYVIKFLFACCEEYRLRFNRSHCYGRVSYLLNNQLPLNISLPDKFINQACNKKLGIDYRNITDTFIAYQLYLKDRWATDKKGPKFTDVNKLLGEK